MISRRELFKKAAQTTVLGVVVLSLAQNVNEVAAYGSSTTGASANWEIPQGTVCLKLEDGVVKHQIYGGDDWIPCDGRALSKAEYPALYGMLGTAYGGRGGRFRIPDTRGRENLSIMEAGYRHDRRRI